LHVLNIATVVADEVVMAHASRIEAGSAALDGHFTHQTCLHQVSQIIISRGSGRAWIYAVHSLENLRSRGMPVAVHQERHYRIALGSTP